MSAKQLLPLSGVLAVLLIVAAFIIGGESPEADDSLREVVSYYTDNDTDIQWASALLALGAFFFLVFSTALSDMLRLARPQSAVASRLTLAGGIVFVVGATIFAGLSFTAADVAEDIAPSGLQTLNALSMDMFFTVIVGTAAFMFGAGIASLKSGLLPKWLAWVAIAIGVVALTPVGFFGFLALGIWSLIASVMLAMRVRDAEPGPAAAA
jgi:MFS family permease